MKFKRFVLKLFEYEVDAFYSEYDPLAVSIDVNIPGWEKLTEEERSEILRELGVREDRSKMA